MLMACFSLCNASLPIASHVCKLRMAAASKYLVRVRVGLHVLLDIIFLVRAASLMLQSWLASLSGRVFDFILDTCFRVAPSFLQVYTFESMGQSEDTSRNVISNILATTVPEAAKHVQSQVELKAGLAPKLSLQIVAVIAGFLLLSAITAWSLRPSASRLGFGRCLNSAICGPLYLLAGEDRSVPETCGYVWRLICLRGLFLASMVAFAWQDVKATHAEVFFAPCSNENVSYRMLALAGVCSGPHWHRLFCCRCHQEFCPAEFGATRS
ncbi:unnamed protein product [Effrenium voratum]|uniref:Uncharacterized protein n=1 Tax=Effrenium voratum TaxID=2562239 RepID=A0AA36MNH7_9DINO|nr:unnamed protein product [Effrenium voratum]CAJ1430331.1 unnamed protein product [Effrenium voratum]